MKSKIYKYDINSYINCKKYFKLFPNKRNDHNEKNPDSNTNH